VYTWQVKAMQQLLLSPDRDASQPHPRPAQARYGQQAAHDAPTVTGRVLNDKQRTAVEQATRAIPYEG
jgi:hypothetical protein